MPDPTPSTCTTCGGDGKDNGSLCETCFGGGAMPVTGSLLLVLEKVFNISADITAIKAKTDIIPENLVEALQDIHGHVEA